MTDIPKQDDEVRLKIALERFAFNMRNKLLVKKSEGRTGWDDPDWPLEDIKKQMIEHIEKDDFVDVANFAMFAWYKRINHD